MKKMKVVNLETLKIKTGAFSFKLFTYNYILYIYKSFKLISDSAEL